MHTPLPWSELVAMSDAKVLTCNCDDGTSFEFMDLYLSHGDKIIGKIQMTAASKGYPAVDNEQECRDNLMLIIKAVNSHDALLAAVKALLGAETPQETLEAAVLAVDAIKLAEVKE